MEAQDHFQELIGQQTAVELLLQAIARNRIAPAYVFTGPPGIGKGLGAMLFAELLLARPRQGSPVASPEEAQTKRRVLRQRVRQRNHPDLFWVEPTYLHQGKRYSAAEAAAQGLKRRSPPQIRLEQIREITQFLGRPPLEAERAVVVVDEADTMAEPAANALLKTLEEPGQATLLLLASGLDALLPTLVSRCQRIAFNRLAPDDLAQVLRQTGHEAVLSQPESLAIAQGSPGAAIESWERLQAIAPEVLVAATQPLISLRMALELARQITKSLDVEAQLWLIIYLQHHYWHQRQTPATVEALESARKALLGYVQPRLVWETTLMSMLEAAPVRR